MGRVCKNFLKDFSFALVIKMKTWLRNVYLLILGLLNGLRSPVSSRNPRLGSPWVAQNNPCSTQGYMSQLRSSAGKSAVSVDYGTLTNPREESHFRDGQRTPEGRWIHLLLRVFRFFWAEVFLKQTICEHADVSWLHFATAISWLLPQVQRRF